MRRRGEERVEGVVYSARVQTLPRGAIVASVPPSQSRSVFSSPEVIVNNQQCQ